MVGAVIGKEFPSRRLEKGAVLTDSLARLVPSFQKMSCPILVTFQMSDEWGQLPSNKNMDSL